MRICCYINDASSCPGQYAFSKKKKILNSSQNILSGGKVYLNLTISEAQNYHSGNYMCSCLSDAANLFTERRVYIIGK